MATEMANRLAKAERIADFLTEHLGLEAAVDLATTQSADWARIANLAGEHLPSISTREAVLSLLRVRAETIDDVFACFPA